MSLPVRFAARWRRILERVSVRLTRSPHTQNVTRGLDPRVHLLRKKAFAKKMDCRVKPGNDERRGLRKRKMRLAVIPCIAAVAAPASSAH